MMDKSEIMQNNDVLSKLEQPRFSSKNVTKKQEIDSLKLENEYKLEIDAKQKAHNRTQGLEDVKCWVKKCVYIGFIPFLLILFIIWCVCCYKNLTEIQACVGWLFSTVISLFVGTLIEKSF